MDLGIFFWVLMIIWFFGYGWANWDNRMALGAGLLQWALFLLLGLKVYPLHV